LESLLRILKYKLSSKLVKFDGGGGETSLAKFN